MRPFRTLVCKDGGWGSSGRRTPGSIARRRVATSEPSDLELVSSARGGDSMAFAALYLRHEAAGKRVARLYSRSEAAAEDLVAEAFTRILATVQRGGGPRLGFRSYLSATIRRLAIDSTAKTGREHLVDDFAAAEIAFRIFDTSHSSAADDTIGDAFLSLPTRWQTILWHLEIEGRTTTEVAESLGIKPGALSALAYRARNGLRRAYLSRLAEPI